MKVGNKSRFVKFVGLGKFIDYMKVLQSPDNPVNLIWIPVYNFFLPETWRQTYIIVSDCVSPEICGILYIYRVHKVFRQIKKYMFKNFLDFMDNLHVYMDSGIILDTPNANTMDAA